MNAPAPVTTSRIAITHYRNPNGRIVSIVAPVFGYNHFTRVLTETQKRVGRPHSSQYLFVVPTR